MLGAALRAGWDARSQSNGVPAPCQQVGRVGFFLRVDGFTAYFERMSPAGIEFVRPPRTESYGRVAVFLDIAGNRRDLIGLSLSGAAGLRTAIMLRPVRVTPGGL